MAPVKVHSLNTATMPSYFRTGWHFHIKRITVKWQVPPRPPLTCFHSAPDWLWQEFCWTLWCTAASHVAKICSKFSPYGLAWSYFSYDCLCLSISVRWVGVHEWHVELHILKMRMSFDRFVMLLSFIQFFTPTLISVVSVITLHSCCPHVCCHALRIPLSTWVRMST